MQPLTRSVPADGRGQISAGIRNFHADIAARTGRNPQTGHRCRLPAHKKAGYRMSKPEKQGDKRA
jgi:nucleoid DNA-binding protein